MNTTLAALRRTLWATLLLLAPTLGFGQAQYAFYTSGQILGVSGGTIVNLGSFSRETCLWTLTSDGALQIGDKYLAAGDADTKGVKSVVLSDSKVTGWTVSGGNMMFNGEYLCYYHYSSMAEMNYNSWCISPYSDGNIDIVKGVESEKLEASFTCNYQQQVMRTGINYVDCYCEAIRYSVETSGVQSWCSVYGKGLSSCSTYKDDFKDFRKVEPTITVTGVNASDDSYWTYNEGSKAAIMNTDPGHDIPITITLTLPGGALDGSDVVKIYDAYILSAPATPVIEHVAATCEAPNMYTISCATTGATIHYTTDGSEPTTSSAAYTAAIDLTTTGGTLRARAYKDGLYSAEATRTATLVTPGTPTITDNGDGTYTFTQADGSDADLQYSVDGGTTWTSATGYTATGTLTLQVRLQRTDLEPSTCTASITTRVPPDAPVIEHVAATCAAPNMYTISCATTGATIHYTTDGSEPTTSSAAYSAAIDLTTTGGTLRARAYKDGLYSAEAILAATLVTPGTPTITDNGDGTYTFTQTDGSDADLQYSVDGGTTWTTATGYAATEYEVTLRVRLRRAGMNTSTCTAQVTTTPIPATPVIEHEAATCAAPNKYTISCATTGATIHYTTDGSLPTASSAAYTAVIDLTTTGGPLRTRAYKDGRYSAEAILAATPVTPGTPSITDNGDYTYAFSQTGGSDADLQYSIDGGATWTSATSFATDYAVTLQVRLQREGMSPSTCTAQVTTTSNPAIKTKVYGSVYGGGKGSMTDKDAARVSGNASVTMDGGQVVRSIYGGGEMASVGVTHYATDEEATTWNNTYTFYSNDVADAADCRMVAGDAHSCTSGGKTSVTIRDGVVGVPSQAAMPKPTEDASDDDYGYVFCAGKGLLLGEDAGARNFAVSGDAELLISGGLITASVYGGSENGQVLGNTTVTISGGQIGVGHYVDGENNDQWDDAYTDGQWTSAIEAAKAGTFDSINNPFHECDAFPYASSRIVYDYYAKYKKTINDTVHYYYDEACTEEALQGSNTDATNGHSFFGNVFGGGSGYYAYAPGKWRRTAGRVMGDTKIVITGGHILTSVYGGNEITDVMGSSTITMTGGTVGVPRSVGTIKKCPVNSIVYGGGMGDPRTWANQWSNVQDATVTIGGDAVVFGSVFGGGEDGHVLGNATTTINGGVIGTTGASGVDGNVFGGGRGFSAYALTAGVVRGIVTLNITDGFIMGSVYGGGRLAAVGTPLVPPTASNYGVMQDDNGTDKHGHITVAITGGTIGNLNYMGKSEYSIGNVFGGSKGTKDQSDEEFNQRLGLSKHTSVSISQASGKTTLIRGNVYGGGELASVGYYTYANATQAADFNAMHPSYGSEVGYKMDKGDVYDAYTKEEISGLAQVTISGGTIGVEDLTIDDGTAHREEGHTKFRTGHVYGAGLGKTGYHYSGYTYVRNTEVSITGDAYVVGSVFGGGENGHVWSDTKVTMDGGQVGQEPDDKEYAEKSNGQGIEVYFGNVYGGGRGIESSGDELGFSVSAGRVHGNTEVLISGGRVTHNVYGGGSLANTGFPNDNTTVGKASVTISGGIIGYDDTDNASYYARAGKNGGRVYGSARGLAGASDGTLAHMAFTRETTVTISSNAKVRGSVFGGGENGHVRENTNVLIEGGEIGVPLQGADHVEDEHGVAPTIYRGNVYGGGRGLDNYVVTDSDGKVIKAHNGEDSVSFSLTAGRVFGNATVNIKGGQIHHHVFGGGSLASVGDTIAKMVIDGSDTTYYDILGNIITGQYTFNQSNNTDTYTEYKRPYRVGDPITNSGTVTVNISGGTIGQLGVNEGHVYGSGRGIAGQNTSQYAHMAFTNNTQVNILPGADIRGSVFGGGANGHVTQNSEVNVSGGTIGTRLSHAERTIKNGVGKRVYRGNVYGGGRGVDPMENTTTLLSNTAGRVFGNSRVTVTGGTIRHNVYGGGSLASVGTFQMVDDDFQIIKKDLNSVTNYEGYATHAYLAGTGKATVIISGGRIGPLPADILKKADGTTDYAQDSINENFAQIGANEGQVYGSGRGVAYTPTDNNSIYSEMAFVKETQVVIKGEALVCGSVFGGGENGHVRFNTDVQIQGGLIGGIPLHNAKGFALNGSTFMGGESTDKVAGFNLAGADSGTMRYKNIVELYELPTGVGRTMYRGNVYGGGRGIDHTGTTEEAEEGTTGYSSSAGRVYGNANITITGGHVLHHVYGGGSIASVGNYKYEDSANPTTPTSVRDAQHGFEYKTAEAMDNNSLTDTIQHPVSGTVTVKVYGGVIGITGINEGRIYCAGRGIAGNHTSQITHLAYCNATYLRIADSLGNIPDIRGSVFGGGANGHVLTSTKVEVLGGYIGWGIKPGLYSGGTWSDGKSDPYNLIGYSLVKDMTVDHDYTADEQGTANTMYRGNVYGGGRGVDPASGSEGTDDSRLSPTAGRVYISTNVHVGGTARVLHNVYGGGSLASVGDTLPETVTYTLSDGNTVQVGKYKPNTGLATVLIDGQAHIGWNGVDNNGQVYGSCRGMPASVGTKIGDQYLRMAYVHDTRVTIDGEAVEVLGSVFGGGANGHVQGDTRVDIKSGTIGVEPPDNPSVGYDYCGNVYGAGRGVDRTEKGLSMTAGYVRGNTEVNILGGKIWHNVYGGGSMALVGDYGLDGYNDKWAGTDAYVAATSAADSAAVFKASGGSTTVNVKAAVGQPNTHGTGGTQWGGNVFGSSRGRANDPSVSLTADYADMAYVAHTQVNLDSAALVYGSVYGGGENGHVDFPGTEVNVVNGRVIGNVFGGGRGSATSPTAGIVDGPTQVNIGTRAQLADLSLPCEVYVEGYVFAGNDAGSSPLGRMRVDVWRTAHDADNAYPEALTVAPVTHDDSVAYQALLDSYKTLPSDEAALPKYYALKAVYGGSNLANVLTGNADTDKGSASTVINTKYITQRLGVASWPGLAQGDRVSTVCIHDCYQNTVRYVYGGGRAASSWANEVTIDGGRVYQVYAGGNGSPDEVPGNPGADVQNDASVLVKGGIVYQAFGGSNTKGVVQGLAKVNFEESDCLFINHDIFGGGNKAKGGSVIVTIPCGIEGLRDVYGGANEADIDGDIVLNVYGGKIDNLFGGSKAADINGSVTVNIYGGDIETVYGGNNESGSISGDIEVNVDWGADTECADPKRIGYVYGAGLTAPYEPNYEAATGKATAAYNPTVNIINATIDHAVFGAGYGTGTTDETNAHVTANPLVVIGADRVKDKEGNTLVDSDDNPAPVSDLEVNIGRSKVTSAATLDGSVFGGGNAGPVIGSTRVVVKGKKTLVNHNVYGGGNAAKVTGKTDVQIGHE